MDCKALISGIALQRGAHLEVALFDPNARSNHILSAIYAIRLSNLQSPTFMEHLPDERTIRLLGPNGSFSFRRISFYGDLLTEFPLPPLTDVRVLHIRRIRRDMSEPGHMIETVAFPPSSLPALETLVIENEIALSYRLSTLFSTPSSSPSLTTLAFLDCDPTDSFMEELARFASNRKNTASARLDRVTIVNSNGTFPSDTSVDALRGNVPVVDVQIGKRLPKDLTCEGLAGQQILP